MSADVYRITLIAGVALALGVVLILVVTLIRIRRSILNRSRIRLRNELLDSWTNGSPDQIKRGLTQVATGSIRGLVDLSTAIEHAHRQGIWNHDLVRAIHAGVVASGLGVRISRCLSDRRETHRGMAVVLSGLGITDIDEHTLATFLSDPEATVRLAAAASLEQFASPAAAQELIKALNFSLLEEPRIIERLGHPWAIPTIIDSLSTDQHTSATRSSLLTALAISRDPRALRCGLEQAASTSGEVLVRALRVVSACSTEATPQQHDQIGSIAASVASSDNSAVRNLAASLLVYAEEPHRTKQLIEMTHDPDWFVRRSAIQSLLKCGPAGRNLVLELTQDPDPFTANRAQEELARMEIRARKVG